MKLSTLLISVFIIAFGVQASYSDDISISIDDTYSNQLQTELKSKHILFKYQPHGYFTISKSRVKDFIDIALGVNRNILSLNPKGPFPFYEEQLNRFGYMNSNGEIVIYPRYAIAHRFNHYNIAAVADEKGWEYIDISGNTYLKPFLYDNGPDYFQEGLSRYIENGLTGFIDEQYTIAIKARFEFVTPFHNGFATFCVGCRKESMWEGSEYSQMAGGKWGAINKKGEVIAKPQYDHPVYFEKNQALVELNGESFYIDDKGNRL